MASQAAQEAVAAAITSLGGAWSAVASSRPLSGYDVPVSFISSVPFPLTLNSERRRFFFKREAVITYADLVFAFFAETMKQKRRMRHKYSSRHKAFETTRRVS